MLSFYCEFLAFQNTIEGRLVYLPIVGRLDCDSTYVDHQGYWEIAGYGLLSVYKSDWMRFGGKRITHKFSLTILFNCLLKH